MTTCPYVCNNKTEFGYCKTTVCVNPLYTTVSTQRSIIQWVLKNDYVQMANFTVQTEKGRQMRLIDAERLKGVMIETLEKIKQNPKMDNQEAHIISAFHTVGLMVDDAPTIDAVPVKNGEWVKKEVYGEAFYLKACSVCGFYHGLTVDYNFCPNCGAKMDGEREENEVD